MHSRRRQFFVLCCFCANHIFFFSLTLGGRGGTKKERARHILCNTRALPLVCGRPVAVIAAAAAAAAAVAAATTAVIVTVSLVVTVRTGVPFLSPIVRLAYGHHLAATSTPWAPLGVLFPHPAVTLVYLLHRFCCRWFIYTHAMMAGYTDNSGEAVGEEVGGGGGHFTEGGLCCTFCWCHTKSVPDTLQVPTRGLFLAHYVYHTSTCTVMRQLRTFIYCQKCCVCDERRVDDRRSQLKTLPGYRIPTRNVLYG